MEYIESKPKYVGLNGWLQLRKNVVTYLKKTKSVKRTAIKFEIPEVTVYKMLKYDDNLTNSYCKKPYGRR